MPLGALLNNPRTTPPQPTDPVITQQLYTAFNVWLLGDIAVPQQAFTSVPFRLKAWTPCYLGISELVKSSPCL